MSGEADRIKGKAKQALGNATDDDRLRGEGEMDEAEGKLKQTVDKIGDAARGAVDKLRGKLD